MVPSFAFRFGRPVTVPWQLTVVRERSVMQPDARLVFEAPPAANPTHLVNRVKRVQVVRRRAARPSIRAAQPAEPEVDVVEQMLDAAAAESLATEPTLTEAVELPGVTPTPAVATPSPEEPSAPPPDPEAPAGADELPLP